ncbi:DUF883 family protein [Campylobacter sp.]|uniref:DUF883 family protein n=1 Tax=Campylobacter sp. TaxID=205 RepID=UPI0026FA63B9|nr:DUF883 domain-containing protein [Campylobacter sp.]
MAAQDLNLESLKKDIDSLKSDLKDIVKSIKDIGAKQIEAGKDKILDHLDTEEIKKYIDELKAKGKDGIETVNDTIKEDPIKSVAIAAGVGFLLAWILKK